MALAPFSGRCVASPGTDMSPLGSLLSGESLPRSLAAPTWSGSSAVWSHHSSAVAAYAAAQPASTHVHRTPLSAETTPRSPFSPAPGSRHASSPAFRTWAAAHDCLHLDVSSPLLPGAATVRVATTARSAASSSISSSSSSISGSISSSNIGSSSIPVSGPSAAEAAVEVLGPNSRRVSASIQVTAPLLSVWSVLTDYYRLADYVPSLARNEVLELREGGARLLQVGEQDVALGLKFQARIVVDVDEEPEQSVPVPGSPVLASTVAVGTYYAGLQGAGPGLAGVEEGAASSEESAAETPEQGEERRQGQGSLLCRRAIRFIMREGDFASFTGRWVLESVQPGTSSAASAAMAPTTRLSYSVDVTPHFWLPVALIEGRITREIGANLSSVALEAMKRASYAA